jgi:ABC-type spermidine/putrescine transport system permease subunit II
MLTTETKDRCVHAVMEVTYLSGVACCVLIIVRMMFFPGSNALSPEGFLTASSPGIVLTVGMLCFPETYHLTGLRWSLAVTFCVTWCLALAFLSIRVTLWPGL